MDLVCKKEINLTSQMPNYKQLLKGQRRKNNMYLGFWPRFENLNFLKYHKSHQRQKEKKKTDTHTHTHTHTLTHKL